MVFLFSSPDMGMFLTLEASDFFIIIEKKINKSHSQVYGNLKLVGVLRDLHLPSAGGEMPFESIPYTEKGRPTIFHSLFCSGLRIESFEDAIQGFKGHG